MKKTIITIILVTLSVLVFSQTPLKINYQAVLHDNIGNTLVKENVDIDIKILKGNVDGVEVFSETHSTTTNDYGIVNLVIGSVESLESIIWNDDIYFVQIWLDGTEMGTSQLLSVPYAMHSKTADYAESTNITGNELIFDNWDKDVTDDFSGDYNDLTNQPTIPDAQNLSDVIAEDNNANGQIKNLANPTEGQDAVTKAYVDSLLMIIASLNSSPLVDFSSSVNTAIINSEILFYDETNFEATNWLWDFGDGNTSTEQNPTHIYTTEGTYSVSLNASNSMFNFTEIKTNLITVTTEYSIGNYAFGGIIVYIFQEGDDYYVPGEQHGVVCAMEDASHSATWGCYGTHISNLGYNIGDGAQNTIEMTTQCAEDGTAASICSQLITNGYDDWFFSTEATLSAVGNNLALINNSLNNYGGDEFDGIYWVTDQRSDFAGNAFDFATLFHTFQSKLAVYKVRPFRMF